MSRPVEKKLKVVGCDLDDVLADFIGNFIRTANSRYGVPEDVSLRPDSWSWDNMGWSKDQLTEMWQLIHDTPDFWATLTALPNVDATLVTRLSEKTELYFPTARAQCLGDSVATQSARFLLNNFSIPFPRVIVSNEKGPLAAALKYDYFIDDRDKNCVDVKLARPECEVFLVNSSHNHNFDEASIGIIRVSGFNEAATLILGGL
jgi:5'(3')-deoxyribonucleotidase